MSLTSDDDYGVWEGDKTLFTVMLVFRVYQASKKFLCVDSNG